MRNRTLMQISVSALLLTVSFIWLAGCSTGNKDMMDDKAMMKAPTKEAGMAGMLTGRDGHHASGKVTIVDDMNGHAKLMFSDFKVDKVPDGYVYLARGADHTNGVKLGMLDRFSGNVAFDVPAGTMVEKYDSVVIWCEQFNVEIGRAMLAGKMMK